ncbi:MAG: L-erythro-3,5-diaminohexanoate dehydrogenase [Deltaproteobacteria bacterium]|nr:L-erythro-3,5-diaminohexanoate dehydrogenase [Deltaproteobacteria bacterium]
MSDSFRTGGHVFGIHRVVSPAGVLPQQADVLDASLPAWDNELVLDVDTLNIDAASFHQLSLDAKSDPAGIAQRITDIVGKRGKMHNPVTQSGGMLIGKLRAKGPRYHGPVHAEPGDRIATLVSLTLTPLSLQEIRKVHLGKDQVDVTGHAILFESGIGARLDGSLPDRLALAILDVCGAPAQVARLVRPGMTVAVLGAGKSGMLCLAQAKHSLAGSGRLLAVDAFPDGPQAAARMGYAHDAIVVDAKKPLDVHKAVEKATGGAMCDLVINTVNVPGTEMATVLAARQGGRAYFFNMATSFQAVALGAEGLARDVECLIGVGFAPGHAEWAMRLVRTEKPLRDWLEGRFS